MCSALDNILKSRMCDPQVRFCERRRGASPFAYSTPQYCLKLRGLSELLLNTLFAFLNFQHFLN